MNATSKPQLIEIAISLLDKNVKKLGESLNETNNAINDAPGAMQSHSDTTRSQLTSVVNVANKSFTEKSNELSFLKEFSRKDLSGGNFQKIQMGSLVVIQKEGEECENYFVLPGGSGIKLDYKGEKIICITPTSPLGKSMLGKKKHETFTLPVGKIREAKIIELF